MDPETLVTFFFKAPLDVRAVELLGSWDNFTRPYGLYHDRRRGAGFWAGCFQFSNIIFDGVEPNWSRPRTGGLKQGGTYWYYFRLNDDVEAFDDLREHTSGCPLLPGQTMNVIHVPRERLESPVRHRSASLDLAGTLADLESMHTMNPDAKFNVLHPPAVSKVHERCVSDLVMGGRSEARSRGSISALSPPRPRAQRGLYRSTGSGSLRRQGSSRSVATSSRSSRPSRCDTRSIRELTTYEASLASEQERSRTLPIQAEQCSSSRPHTRHGDSATTGFDFGFMYTSPPTHHPKTARTNTIDRSDAASIGPHSIHNIQFLSTSPDSSHQQPRQRHYSLHNANEPAYHIGTHMHACSATSARTSSSPANFDLASPTFSAATLSSNGGGLNTPFRLSGGCQLTAASCVNADSLEDVSDRLRRLEPRSNRAAYELPAQSMTPKQQTLILHPPPDRVEDASRDTQFGLPFFGIGRQGREESSMVDAIFSELGYLSGAIL